MRSLTYGELIRGNRNFRNLLAGQFISELGNWFNFIAGLGLAAGYFFKPAGLKILKLSLWCYAFMMLGYFVYFSSIIRSNANPAIDMNNVDNPINLVYYLSREQYGSAPLVYGPHFVAQRLKEDKDNDGYYDLKEKEMKYVKGKDKYIPIGRDK